MVEIENLKFCATWTLKLPSFELCMQLSSYIS